MVRQSASAKVEMRRRIQYCCRDKYVRARFRDMVTWDFSTDFTHSTQGIASVVEVRRKAGRKTTLSPFPDVYT